MLTVQEYEQKTMYPSGFGGNPMEYPSCQTLMNYTLFPEPEPRRLLIRDLSESDQPRAGKIAADSASSDCGAAAIGLIGGADGPTTTCIGAPSGGASVCVLFVAVF